METKSKYRWSEERKAAASERMREVQKKRWAVREEGKIVPIKEEVQAHVLVEEKPIEATWEKPDPNDPRLAKLRGIQREVLQDIDAQRALERHGEEKGAQVEGSMVEPPVDATKLPPYVRPGSKEVSLIVRNDGTMVSQYGPCVCGAPKRMWHKLCLREGGDGERE